MNIQSPRLVWIAGLGLFLATLDTGIMNIALPTLQAAWHTTAATIAWTVVAYTVTLAGTVLFWGRLADRTGSQRIFWWGLIGFAVASGACGAAPTLDWLMAARALQGLASAMIQGTAIALATQDLPPAHQNLATGTLALLQGLGPVIGPALGGIVLTWTSWRGLFWINLPVTIPLIALLARRHAPLPQRTGEAPALDVTGNGLVMLTVSTGLLALTVPGPLRTLCTAAAMVAVVATLWWERLSQSPLIPRSLWSSRTFWAAAGAVVMVGGATALGFMVPPYMLHLWGHWAPWQVGLINLSAPLMLVVFSRPASRLLNRQSAARVMLGGLGLMAGAFAVLAITAGNRSPILLVLGLGSYGLGAAAFFPANLTAILAVTGRDAQGVMGALQRMAINLGTAIDAAVVGAFLVHGAHGHGVSQAGIRTSWAYGMTTLLTAMAGLLLAHHRRSRAGADPRRKFRGIAGD